MVSWTPRMENLVYHLYVECNMEWSQVKLDLVKKEACPDGIVSDRQFHHKRKVGKWDEKRAMYQETVGDTSTRAHTGSSSTAEHVRSRARSTTIPGQAVMPLRPRALIAAHEAGLPSSDNVGIWQGQPGTLLSVGSSSSNATYGTALAYNAITIPATTTTTPVTMAALSAGTSSGASFPSCMSPEWTGRNVANYRAAQEPSANNTLNNTPDSLRGNIDDIFPMDDLERPLSFTADGPDDWDEWDAIMNKTWTPEDFMTFDLGVVQPSPVLRKRSSRETKK